MHENSERDPPTENLPSVDQILEKHGRVIEEEKGDLQNKNTLMPKSVPIR